MTNRHVSYKYASPTRSPPAARARWNMTRTTELHYSNSFRQTSPAIPEIVLKLVAFERDPGRGCFDVFDGPAAQQAIAYSLEFFLYNREADPVEAAPTILLAGRGECGPTQLLHVEAVGPRLTRVTANWNGARQRL